MLQNLLIAAVHSCSNGPFPPPPHTLSKIFWVNFFLSNKAELLDKEKVYFYTEINGKKMRECLDFGIDPSQNSTLLLTV
jgi:hypothetical protein